MAEIRHLRSGNAVLREQLLEALQDPHGGVGRDRRDLPNGQRAGSLVDQREIGKGAADVNADSVPHGPLLAATGPSSCRLRDLGLSSMGSTTGGAQPSGPGYARGATYVGTRSRPRSLDKPRPGTTIGPEHSDPWPLTPPVLHLEGGPPWPTTSATRSSRERRPRKSRRSPPPSPPRSCRTASSIRCLRRASNSAWKRGSRSWPTSSVPGTAWTGVGSWPPAPGWRPRSSP